MSRSSRVSTWLNSRVMASSRLAMCRRYQSGYMRRKHWKSLGHGTLLPGNLQRLRKCGRRLAWGRKELHLLESSTQATPRSNPGVKVIGTFPADSHQAIIYPVAATVTAKLEADTYLSYLRSTADIKAVSDKYGFIYLWRRVACPLISTTFATCYRPALGVVHRFFRGWSLANSFAAFQESGNWHFSDPARCPT